MEDNQVIQAPLSTKIYLRFFKKNAKLEAGDYLFPLPISPLEVLNQLKDGKKRTKALTIPEGWTRFEIAKRIVNQFPGEPQVTEKEVLAMMEEVSLIQDMDPKATNLEGYLYPTTYQFELEEYPNRSLLKWWDNLNPSGSPNGMSWREKLEKLSGKLSSSPVSSKTNLK